MKQYRVWAELNQNSLKRNIQMVKRRLKPTVKILVVVKADGYGHGAIPTAWKAIEAGAEMLGVGDSSEAIQLRESGITNPILILGAIIEEEVAKVVEYDIAVTVHSMDFLDTLNNEAGRQGKRLKVHLKVDTGMGRLGASPSRAVEIAREIIKSPYLEFEGISTHLSSVASQNLEYTASQLERFNRVLEELKSEGIKPPIVHVANSAGLFMTEKSHFN